MTHPCRLGALVLSAVLFTLPALAQAAPPKTATHPAEHTHQAKAPAKEAKHAKAHPATAPVASKPATQPHSGKSPH
jgi:hypothetical protein